MCEKYESLFIFGDEEKFFEHISKCKSCADEYEKMQKVSSLIQEVRPYYKKRQKKTRFLKVACSLLLLVFCSCSFLYMNTDFTDTLKYGTTLSAQDYGFPVDDYGLIMVE